MRKLDAPDLVLNTHIHLLLCLHNVSMVVFSDDQLCCFNYAIDILNENASLVYPLLYKKLNSATYAPIGVALTHLFQMLISNVSSNESDTIDILKRLHLNVFFRVYNRKYSGAVKLELMSIIFSILRQLSRFGFIIINYLTELGALEFLLSFQNEKRLNQTQYNQVLNMLYGGNPFGMRDLSLTQLFALANTMAPYVVLRALEELDRRLPEVLDQLSPLLQNPQALRGSISLSLQSNRSFYSAYSRSQSGEDDDNESCEAFENDFLSQPSVYSRNSNLHSSIRSLTEGSASSKSTAIKRAGKRTESDASPVPAANDSVSKSQLAEVMNSLNVLRNVLFRVGYLRYDAPLELQYSILRRLPQVLMHYCKNEALCERLWRERIIKELIGVIGYAKGKKKSPDEQRVDDDASFYSIGCLLLFFFRRYHGDISELWMMQGNDRLLTLRVLELMVNPRTASEKTCSLFLLLFATVLRCPQLRPDFMKTVDICGIVRQYNMKSPILMESISYLLG